jgi:uncharacterized protein YbgA (DUF1722 family)/uncharacterized protein YbbK (DUF523 family)
VSKGDPRIRLGISACLLGERVRFDGGHKRDAFLVETLGRFVEWVPVCPEVESGMGAPREPMRLVRQAGGELHLRVTGTGEDLTGMMNRYTRRRIEGLAGEDLCGYVLKKNSPTCGLEGVKAYSSTGKPAKPGRGLFANAIVSRFPLLPVEEEGRLDDPRLRENFVERVFAYQRLRTLFGSRWTMGEVVRFQTIHKLTLMAHQPQAYRRLGRLVGTGKTIARRDFQESYSSAFMAALAVVATPRRHTNVLQHMHGYLRKMISSESRAELLAVIEDYARGQVPLADPLALFAHHIRRCGVTYLADQTYMQPHPSELMLRNQV